ncbi:sigma-70 family RNA polymerase sigma factor [Lentzea sp. CA-135723]|uniref:sigma-70 family RNA polymerase sigma factor n=1 Tax=Lentzea sp. CA-135723 TaxID=3239950 RepID=UPI003D8E5F66
MDARAALEQVEATADPEQRLIQAHHLVSEFASFGSEAARIRREAAEALTAKGKSQVDIGKLIDLSRSRVGQIISHGPRPQRAFLGSGKITVAIGGKQEGQKVNPSAVISAEALSAYKALDKLASSFGLEAEYELIPPPGIVRLNRPNLIVMTSPRLLPLVGQVLESDQSLAFESGAQGWYLRDNASGIEYRSPSDSGEAADYAYIGRLPRPDGQGTFLYLAGIHAMGTRGAAQFLVDNIDDLYDEVKKKRFSTLIRCDYHPDTREITATQQVTPIYTV